MLVHFLKAVSSRKLSKINKKSFLLSSGSNKSQRFIVLFSLPKRFQYVSRSRLLRARKKHVCSSSQFHGNDVGMVPIAVKALGVWFLWWRRGKLIKMQNIPSQPGKKSKEAKTWRKKTGGVNLHCSSKYLLFAAQFFSFLLHPWSNKRIMWSCGVEVKN